MRDLGIMHQTELELDKQTLQISMAYFKKDMLSISTRNLLADYLADLTLLVNSLEAFREALAEQEGFEGLGLFRFLDRDQKGFLTIPDFEWIVGNSSKKLLHYAFSWFDVSKVGQISRLQFLDFLLPREDEQLRQAISIRMATPVEQYGELPATISIQIDLFRDLTVELMKRETHLIPRRLELMKQDDYSIKAVMNSLGNSNKGWINAEDLYKFLKNYDVDVSISQVKQLLGNYDTDINGKITSAQLSWVIEGLQNKQSPYRKLLRYPNSAVKTTKRDSSKTPQKKSNTKPQSSSKNLTKQNQNTIYSNTKTKQKNPKISLKAGAGSKSKKFAVSKQNASNISMQNLQLVSERSGKGHKDSHTKQKSNKKYLTSDFSIIKESFELLEKQANEIDKELISYDLQLEQKNRLELLKQLERVKLEKQLRKQQLIQQIEQEELLRRQREQLMRRQERERIRRQQIELALREQERRIIEDKIRQEEVLKRVEEEDRLLNEQENHIVWKERDARTKRSYTQDYQHPQAEAESSYRNQVVEARLRASMIANQHLRRDRCASSHKVWEQARMSRYLRQREYFWKYNMHVRQDPLGIQAHLAETDKHLQKSKQLRKDIHSQKYTNYSRTPLKITRPAPQSGSSRYLSPTPSRLAASGNKYSHTIQTKLEESAYAY